MKLSKWEGAVILIAAVFLSFTAGWFLRGSGGAEPLRVETQRTLKETVTVIPAPTAGPEIEKVNINTADAETLQTLPDIGQVRAAAIIADREANGPYHYPEEITRVKGIGEETAAKLMDYITTGEEESQ